MPNVIFDAPTPTTYGQQSSTSDALLGQRGTTTSRPDSSTLVSQAEPFTGHLPKTTRWGQKSVALKSPHNIRVREAQDFGRQFDIRKESNKDYKVWSNPKLTRALNTYTDRLSNFKQNIENKSKLDNIRHRIKFTQNKIKEFSLVVNGDLIRSQQNR